MSNKKQVIKHCCSNTLCGNNIYVIMHFLFKNLFLSGVWNSMEISKPITRAPFCVKYPWSTIVAMSLTRYFNNSLSLMKCFNYTLFHQILGKL